MEAGPNFEQRPHAAVEFGPAERGLGDARQDLEQSGLAGAVPADDADDGAARHLERDIPKGPEVVLPLLAAPPPQGIPERIPERFAQSPVRIATDADSILLAQTAGCYRDIAHQITSANVRSTRRK